MMQNNKQIRQRIKSLQTILKESDYKAIKYAEGLISEEEYVSTRMKRQAIRSKIKELEKQLNK